MIVECLLVALDRDGLYAFDLQRVVAAPATQDESERRADQIVKPQMLQDVKPASEYRHRARREKKPGKTFFIGVARHGNGLHPAGCAARHRHM